MTQELPSRRRPAIRLAVALAVALALVLSAPFVGQIRAFIRQAFPGHFVLVVGTLIAAGVAAALISALVRIRERRLTRYGAILLSLAIAAGYSIYNARDNPESNVVELFHFLQYGLIAFLFYRVWRGAGDLSVLVLPTLAALMVGTVEEWFQWFIPNRVGEMNDVLLNLVAIGSGLLFSLAVDPPNRLRLSLDGGSRRRVSRVAAAAVVTFAAFFHIVHLGHVVEESTIGAFDSRWTRAKLLELQTARRAAWAVTPPPVKLVRLSREDQYLTEGIQHVRERNRLWSAGNIRGAWLENLILESFFEPVLDTPTHEGQGHRWPAEQHADAESRAASAASVEPYSSHAFPYRLYMWPKWLFWLAVGAVGVAVVLAGQKSRPTVQTVG